MARWKKVSLFLTMLYCPLGLFSQSAPTYRNPKLPIEQRVADLLSRMTLEEKAAQLIGGMERSIIEKDMKSSIVDQNGNFSPDRAAEWIKHGLGQISQPGGMRSPGAMAKFTNAIQKWAKEKTRLGIPILFHQECLHGHVASKGTSFPQALALASTWDPPFIETVFSSIASEVRAAGAQQCLAPVLDISRDPRWGRTEETYGEDPHLASRIGVAAVRGFQGKGPVIDNSHVIATAKHFAVHGQPEGGANTAPGNYSERIIRDFFLKPFEAAVKEGRIQSVMASYNEIDGVPSHGNKWLLNDVLRKEWGFTGVVVSDYYGVDQLRRKHYVASTKEESARLALESGVDIELPAADNYLTLAKQVKEGRISKPALDRAVARVLRSKFLTGLFDDPFVDPAHAEKTANSVERRNLALEAARKSIILLKNQGGLLPIDPARHPKIAIIGPNAAEARLGGYSGRPPRTVSILQGIKDKIGAKNEILHAEGCRIIESPPMAEKVVFGDPVKNEERIREAVKIAQTADLIILALGGTEQTAREAWGPNHLGDRDDLDLPGGQDELAKAMVALQKPIVAVLIHGRPNSINYIAENIPAILEGWYLGQEGGTAVADVLFGDYNPGGKLPITIPRSVGQLPVYYYQKPSARLQYVGSTAEPLYPFGWGLSYSTFKYSNLTVSPASIGPQDKAIATVDVANLSGVRGDEVVQLYIRDEVSSVTRPIKELKGFRRISIDPGKTERVEFTLGFDELSFLNREMKRVVEPGQFKIMVGGNSVDLIETTLAVAPKAKAKK